MSTAAIWVSAIAAILSVVVSVAALRASNTATAAVQNAERVNERIELALQKFEKVLMDSIDTKYASKELTAYQFKDVIESISQIDRQLNRNSEHVSLMLQSLLNKGLNIPPLAAEGKSV